MKQPGDPPGWNEIDRHEQERREGLIRLIEAGRGGGILHFGSGLKPHERQEIRERAEASDAWKSYYGSKDGVPPDLKQSLMPLGLILLVMLALMILLLLLK